MSFLVEAKPLLMPIWDLIDLPVSMFIMDVRHAIFLLFGCLCRDQSQRARRSYKEKLDSLSFSQGNKAILQMIFVALFSWFL
jgi:hypothetical protein